MVARMQMDPSGRHHPAPGSFSATVDTMSCQPLSYPSALKEKTSPLTMLWDRFFPFRTAIWYLTVLYSQFRGRSSAHGSMNALTYEPLDTAPVNVPVGNTKSLNCMLPTVSRWDRTGWPGSCESGSGTMKSSS